jgi:hypothetical protein
MNKKSTLPKSPAQQARYKMTTDIPASVTTPDNVVTRLGTLKFFDGFPDEATVQKVYDNLDFQRGVEAFVSALPAASLFAVRAGFRNFGPDNQTVLITESLMDSRSLYLTANTDTLYIGAWLNTNDGPLVIEVPPRMLGMVDDAWFRFVTDLGNAGPDHGKGGRYLLLPPGYTGEVPEGYFVVRSRTCGNLLFSRGFIENGDLRPAVENTRKNFRVYPLARSANPPVMNFVNISGADFNTVFASDASFYEQVAAVVRDEPLQATDPEMRGLLSAIGIRKDQPFAPDARMKGILADAAAVGNATARAIAFSTRDPEAYLYPGSRWKVLWIGNDTEFSPGGILNPDARTLFFYPVIGISPSMAVKLVGISSQYASTGQDAAGCYLDGSKNYRLHLPPGIPAKDFWSVTVYDPQTRSMLQTDQQFPSTGSQKKGILINADTSVDAWFGPEPPPGKEANWVQTIAGKGWFVILRLYGPLEPWFDKTWRPGEIELV